jgi:hypothetical protein
MVAAGQMAGRWSNGWPLVKWLAAVQLEKSWVAGQTILLGTPLLPAQ